MGGSQSSTTTVTQLSKTITNIAESVVQNCQTSSTQSQSTVVNNTGFALWGTYGESQTSTISAQCFQDADLQTKLQNGIINAITQATNADGSSIMPAFGNTSSTANTNITNIVRTNVTMKNVQNNYNSISQNQNIVFNNSGVVGFQSSQLTQGASIFAAATLKALDDAGVFNSIQNHVSQQSTASDSLFNLSGLFSGLFGGLSEYEYVLVFLIVVYVGYEFYASRGADKHKPADAEHTPPALGSPASTAA